MSDAIEYREVYGGVSIWAESERAPWKRECIGRILQCPDNFYRLVPAPQPYSCKRLMRIAKMIGTMNQYLADMSRDSDD